MARYAERTDVTSDRSRTEIEKTLMRYGADQFAYARSGTQAMVAFIAHERQIRFTIPMPDRNSREFTLTATGRERSVSAADAEYEMAVRQRWRALALVVKAKLEAVAAGIAEFQDEFAAYVVLPNGSTVGEWLGPQIDHAYATSEMPSLLPGSGGPRAITTGGQ